MNRIEKLLDYRVIDEKDIPAIPLYMDQLTYLLDENLSKLNRNEDEKTLTKTMINNYVKGKVVDAPIKKKYSKEQIMKLTMIYQMKNVLSISDLKLFFDKLDESDEAIDEYYTYYKEEQDRISKELDRFKSLIYELKNSANPASTDDISLDKDLIKEVISLSIEADMKRRLSELLVENL